MKRILPVISIATQCLGQSDKGGDGKPEDSSVYSDTKHLHYATVETEHPYKDACVSYYKVFRLHSSRVISILCMFLGISLADCCVWPFN